MGALNLIPDYDALYSDLRYCRDVRNQYGHCQWFEGEPRSILFCDMKKAVLDPQSGQRMLQLERIDLALLRDQERFLDQTYQRMVFLKKAYTARLANAPDVTLPSATQRPALNCPSQGYSAKMSNPT